MHSFNSATNSIFLSHTTPRPRDHCRARGGKVIRATGQLGTARNSDEHDRAEPSATGVAHVKPAQDRMNLQLSVRGAQDQMNL